MAPVQQAMPLASRAAAKKGVQRRITARRQTNAAIFFPGAIGEWSDEFMGYQKRIPQSGANSTREKIPIRIHRIMAVNG